MYFTVTKFFRIKIINCVVTLIISLQDADYIGVGLENGLLRLVWSFHRNNSILKLSSNSVKIPHSSRVLSRLVPTAGFLADGEWHTLVLRMEKHNISLLVDKVLAYVEEPGLHIASDYDDLKLYIGGYFEKLFKNCFYLLKACDS